MSKIGPPQLRAKLYMSALCGKIHNKRMHNIYDELCLRGKPKMVAIGALMRTLVHWCYGVLKTKISVFLCTADFWPFLHRLFCTAVHMN